MRQFFFNKIILYIQAITLVIVLNSCNYKPTLYSPERVEVNSNIIEDSNMISLISPYKNKLTGEMNRNIGYFAHDMFKKKPESELGNFLCDASQEYYNSLYSSNVIDFTIMNYGGIRVQQIPQGEVTVQTMFELMPFENELVTMEVPGEIVQEVFNRIAENRGWPVSKSIQLLITEGKVNLLVINDEPFDVNKTYTLLTTDYIANGGDGMSMFANVDKQKTNLKLRDVLIAYCEWKLDNQETISAPITGRIIVTE